MTAKPELMQLDRLDHLQVQLADERAARLENEAELAMRKVRQSLPEELRAAREARSVLIAQIQSDYGLSAGDEMNVQSGKLSRCDRTIKRLHAENR